MVVVDCSVRVFQLIAEDTVEDRVLAVQKKKDELIRQVSIPLPRAQIAVSQLTREIR